MSKKKHAPSIVMPPQSERQVWTYWISRDSAAGELSAVCQLWYAKPTRKKEGVHVMWQGACWLGACSPEDSMHWFRVKPDTDLELIVCQTYPTPDDLERQRQECDTRK